MHNAETGINPSRCRLQQIKDNCCGLLFFCFLILYFAINDADLLGLLRKAYLVARKLKLRDFEEWINHESNLKVIQSIMGHADIATTMNIYVEATKNRNIQTAEVINNSDSFF
ncbi:MAG: hypothetical protein IKF10_01815 [Lachnospiraceae bacterium]|nr:hypothetical protein [Lachnospiraceae bacterium]